MNTPHHAEPAIALIGPQLGENIGAAARIMANFGLGDLRIAAPRDGWPNPKAQAMAAGADAILETAQVTDGFAAAIDTLDVVYAATARPRGLEKPVYGPREGVLRLWEAVRAGARVGVMFGSEKSGLPNDAVAVSDAILTYPVDVSFASLNLAQAVAVFCYEWRTSQGDAPPTVFAQAQSPPAAKADLFGLYGHLEDELERAGFFHPPEKKPMMVDNLRASLARASLTHQEVQTWRGVVRVLAEGRGPYKVRKDEA
ncbi:MAG: RNA methyltransferase [Maricaulaceae bacterium]